MHLLSKAARVASLSIMLAVCTVMGEAYRAQQSALPNPVDNDNDYLKQQGGSSSGKAPLVKLGVAPQHLSRRSSEPLPKSPFELTPENEEIAEFEEAYGGLVADCVCDVARRDLRQPRNEDEAAEREDEVRDYFDQMRMYDVHSECIMNIYNQLLQQEEDAGRRHRLLHTVHRGHALHVVAFHNQWGFGTGACMCLFRWRLAGAKPTEASEQQQRETCRHLAYAKLFANLMFSADATRPPLRQQPPPPLPSQHQDEGEEGQQRLSRASRMVAKMARAPPSRPSAWRDKAERDARSFAVRAREAATRMPAAVMGRLSGGLGLRAVAEQARKHVASAGGSGERSGDAASGTTRRGAPLPRLGRPMGGPGTGFGGLSRIGR